MSNQITQSYSVEAATCLAAIETVSSSVSFAACRYANTLAISESVANNLVSVIRSLSELVLNAQLSTVGLTSTLQNTLATEIITSVEEVKNSIPMLDGGVLTPSRQSSILRACGKNSDENLHSAILTAMLDLDTVGPFAHVFFAELVKAASGSITLESPAYQFANKEVQLASLGYDDGVGLRRLDILVLRPEEILVIENKIWSSESDSQTSDYAEAIENLYPERKRYYILLSPFGGDGDCPDFKGLSYKQLHSCLSNALRMSPDIESRIPKFYLDELSDIIFDFYR